MAGLGEWEWWCRGWWCDADGCKDGCKEEQSVGVLPGNLAAPACAWHSCCHTCLLELYFKP